MLAEMHYGIWYPPQLSTHGGAIDRLIDVLHWFMILLFVGWGIFFTYCLVRFRSRTGHTATYHPVKGTISKVVEAGVLGFELVLLIGLSMPVWADYKNKPPAASENPLKVHVVAQQFQWNFHYAGLDGVFGRTSASAITDANVIGLVEEDPAAKDDLVKVGQFFMPVDRPIIVELTSKDVIHSFSIPTLRVKQDTIPGMRIPIWFKALPDATSDRIREEMTTRVPLEKADWYKLRHHVAAQDHRDKGGEVVLAKGKELGFSLEQGRETIEKLRKAGVKDDVLVMQPREPLEVVCAQLCGNQHYKMKAQVIAMTNDAFENWLKTEVEKKGKPTGDFDF